MQKEIEQDENRSRTHAHTHAHTQKVRDFDLCRAEEQMKMSGGEDGRGVEGGERGRMAARSTYSRAIVSLMRAAFILWRRRALVCVHLNILDLLTRRIFLISLL